MTDTLLGFGFLERWISVSRGLRDWHRAIPLAVRARVVERVLVSGEHALVARRVQEVAPPEL
jgi:hypothetical protein